MTPASKNTADPILPPDADTLPVRALAIRVQNLSVRFGEKSILDNLFLEVFKGEILGFVGGSGTGKSVLMRTILGLIEKTEGTIEILGQKHMGSPHSSKPPPMGVLFQQGALFSSLTVKQNVQVPIREHLRLPSRLSDALAMFKIESVGLPADAANKFPSELSGGMIKRAGLARALALDPEILFLDEPTAGLDPIGAAELDSLIVALKENFGLTVFMVTHDLDSLVTICDRIAVLGKGRISAIAPLEALIHSDDPWIHEYFCGVRGRKVVPKKH